MDRAVSDAVEGVVGVWAASGRAGPRAPVVGQLERLSRTRRAPPRWPARSRWCARWGIAPSSPPSPGSCRRGSRSAARDACAPTVPTRSGSACRRPASPRSVSRPGSHPSVRRSSSKLASHRARSSTVVHSPPAPTAWNRAGSTWIVAVGRPEVTTRGAFGQRALASRKNVVRHAQRLEDALARERRERGTRCAGDDLGQQQVARGSSSRTACPARSRARRPCGGGRADPRCPTRARRPTGTPGPDRERSFTPAGVMDEVVDRDPLRPRRKVRRPIGGTGSSSVERSRRVRATRRTRRRTASRSSPRRRSSPSAHRVRIAEPTRRDRPEATTDDASRRPSRHRAAASAPCASARCGVRLPAARGRPRRSSCT